MSTLSKAIGASVLVLATLPGIASADAKKVAISHALLSLQSGSEFVNQASVVSQTGGQYDPPVWPIQVSAYNPAFKPSQSAGTAHEPTDMPDITINATAVDPADFPQQVWASPI